MRNFHHAKPLTSPISTCTPEFWMKFLSTFLEGYVMPWQKKVGPYFCLVSISDVLWNTSRGETNICWYTSLRFCSCDPKLAVRQFHKALLQHKPATAVCHNAKRCLLHGLKKVHRTSTKQKNHQFHGSFIEWFLSCLKWISQQTKWPPTRPWPRTGPSCRYTPEAQFWVHQMLPKKSHGCFFSMFPTNKKVCNNLCHINGLTSCCRLGEKNTKHIEATAPKTIIFNS